MKLKMLALLFSIFFSCNEWKGFSHGEEDATRLKSYSNQIIIDWSNTTHQIMFGPAYVPMVGARIHAMVHLAMHDALNNAIPVYETYALKEADLKANPVAAAASAAHTILIAIFPDKSNQLDSVLNASLDKVPSGDAKSRGITLGIKAGNAILALRENDGAFQNPIAEVTSPAEPGVFQGVPPTPFLFAPFWATMKPFSLQSPDQFRLSPHPALNSEEYTTDFEEVKNSGVKMSSIRTDDQTAYAKFWYELSEIGWNRITQIAASQKKLDLLSTARLFALVNMALVDSYTAGWDSKYHYNFWRPYTAIHSAATDGNDATLSDNNWESLMDTPPVQDYPSTHSALGNAAATVLASVVGDNTKFTMTSPSADPANPTRSFKSFSHAAKENADSRVMAGIHFRFSCDAGLDLGKRVGQWTVQNHLRLLKTVQ
jgi:hypothetical protein